MRRGSEIYPIKWGDLGRLGTSWGVPRRFSKPPPSATRPPLRSRQPRICRGFGVKADATVAQKTRLKQGVRYHKKGHSEAPRLPTGIGFHSDGADLDQRRLRYPHITGIAEGRHEMEINYERWGFQERVSLGAVHEAFAIHTGDFRGCCLHQKTRRGAKLLLVHL